MPRVAAPAFRSTDVVCDSLPLPDGDCCSDSNDAATGLSTDKTLRNSVTMSNGPIPAIDFSSLLLSPAVLDGLHAAGFSSPSPIQRRAIPLGRLGVDLIAQAKSGTGKTAVFSVIALETALLQMQSQSSSFVDCVDGRSSDVSLPRVLIVAPTREIAIQICDVTRTIGSFVAKVSCHVFVGGLALSRDRRKLAGGCDIVVGTTGRLLQLIQLGVLQMLRIRLLIIDEVDQMLQGGFSNDIATLMTSLPLRKQILAFSATLSSSHVSILRKYMRQPQEVRLIDEHQSPVLVGVTQYYVTTTQKSFESKITLLARLLDTLPFTQSIVFCNNSHWASMCSRILNNDGFPSLYVAATKSQPERMSIMRQMREFELRVLVCSDLIARGVDMDRVNLVINLDIPRDAATYLHRIGRTGRFGSAGVAVTILCDEAERELLRGIEKEYNIQVENGNHVLGFNTTVEMNSGEDRSVVGIETRMAGVVLTESEQKRLHDLQEIRKNAHCVCIDEQVISDSPRAPSERSSLKNSTDNNDRRNEGKLMDLSMTSIDCVGKRSNNSKKKRIKNSTCSINTIDFSGNEAQRDEATDSFVVRNENSSAYRESYLYPNSAAYQHYYPHRLSLENYRLGHHSFAAPPFQYTQAPPIFHHAVPSYLYPPSVYQGPYFWRPLHR